MSVRQFNAYIGLIGILLYGFFWHTAQAKSINEQEANYIYTVVNGPAVDTPFAVQELGRLQSTPGLRATIGTNYLPLIDLYRKSYPVSKGALLKPDIQQLIVEYIDNSSVLEKLVLFLVAQPYDQRELFDLLLTRIDDEEPVSENVYWYQILTHTNSDVLLEELFGSLNNLGPVAKTHILGVLAQRSPVEALPLLELHLKSLRDIDTIRTTLRHISNLNTKEAIDLLLEMFDHYRQAGPTHLHINAICALLGSLRPDSRLDYGNLIRRIPYKHNPKVARAYIHMATSHRAEAAASDMLFYLHNSDTYVAAFEALAAINSKQVWLDTRQEIEKAYAVDTLQEDFYRTASKLLDTQIENAGRHFADRPAGDLARLLIEEIGELERKYAVHGDPSADIHNYFWSFLSFLQALEELPEKLGTDLGMGTIKQILANGYRKLGNYYRLLRHDPHKAVLYYDLAVKNAAYKDHFKSYISFILAAETYYFDLDNKEQAIWYYMAALGNLARLERRNILSPPEIWLQRWLEAEIIYLRDGIGFSGVLNGQQVTGISFFSFLGSQYLDLKSLGIVVDENHAVMHLRRFPKSHFFFFKYIKALREEDNDTFEAGIDAIDPSNYWLTSYFGMMEYQEMLAKNTRMSQAQQASLQSSSGIKLAFEEFRKKERVKFNFRHNTNSARADQGELPTPGKTFEIIKNALENGDLDRFLSCLSEDSRDQTRRMMGGMSRGEMAELGQSLILGEPISRSDHYFEYMMFSEYNIPANSVIFVLDKGIWKASNLQESLLLSWGTP